MTPKIIYMTNIDRRYFMMRRALDELIADGEMPASSQVVKTEDALCGAHRGKKNYAGAHWS